jgi:Transposase family tnp2
MSLILGLGLPDVKVSSLLQGINSFCPIDVFGSTASFFSFFDVHPTSTQLVCTRTNCSGAVKLTGNSHKCILCHKVYEKSALVKKRSYFLFSPLTPQIKDIMENDELIEKMERHKEETTSNSVVQSSQYKFLQETGQISPVDITLQFNTDGVSATNSSKLSFWPVLVTINELPLKLRTENMLLTAVWMGKSKPKMETFLDPVIEELKALSVDGIETKRGTIKVHTILCPVDSPARADLMKVLYPGGTYACPWCYRRAKSVHKGSGTTRVFKHKRLKKARDTRNYIAFAKIRFISQLDHYKGIKGVSPLSKIPIFNVVSGFVVDYMHAICIGLCNQYLEAFLGVQFSKKPWSLRSKIEQADALVMKITPPTEITRLPEPLSNYKGMKASLKKSLFCYFLIPIMKALNVPQKYINNAFLMVYFFRKYLQSTLNAIEAAQARHCLQRFHSQLETLFTDTMMTFNVHIISHIPDICEMWGGLWDCSTFNYESKNGLLTNLHHGTVHQNDQIMRNFHRLRYVKRSEISKPDYTNNEVYQIYRTSIGGKKETKGSIRVGNCLLTIQGKSKILSQQLLHKIEKEIHSVPLPKAQPIKRFLINGIVACTKNYLRMVKRRNYVFKTNDGRYIAVHEVFLLSFEDGDQKVIAVGPFLNRNNEQLAWDEVVNVNSTEFVDSVTEDNDTSVVNVETLMEKLFCFDVEEKTFVTPLVNIFEGD